MIHEGQPQAFRSIAGHHRLVPMPNWITLSALVDPLASPSSAM